MVILKKIRAASLMETLIATILIMVIFMLSSLILNNLFSNAIKSDIRGITAKLNQLEYEYLNDEILAPYEDEYDKWFISITTEPRETKQQITIEAEHSHNKEIIRRTLYD